MRARERLLFSIGALGGNAVGRSLDLWLLFFYLGDTDGDPPRRAPAALVAGALLLVRIVEALDDPLIGALSDRTRSRLGRRVPYILLATPFASLCFVLIWLPPFDGEQARNAWYLLGIIWAYYLFNTLMTGPYEAMLPAVAASQRDRMSVSTWSVGFGVLGAALALVASGPLIDAFGFASMATVMAIVGLVTRYAGLAGVWRASIEVDRRHSPLELESSWAAIRGCLQNPHFRVFLPSSILYQLAVQLITAVLPFLVTAVLLRSDTGATVAALTGSAILVLLLALPGVLTAVRSRGKGSVYGAGMLLAAVYFPLMAFVGSASGLPPYVQALLYAAPLGVVFAPSQTLPLAIMADICDEDRRRTGQRREATFYATQHTLEKTVGAATPAILALLLTLGDSPGDALGIRLVGPLAGVFAAIGYVTFRRYELTPSDDERTLATVA